MIGLQVFLTKTSLGRFATKSLELSGAMWSTGRTVSRLLTSKDNFWTWNTYINSKEIINSRDKSGTINQSELQEALTTFGYNLSPQVQTKSHHPPPSYHSRKFQKGLMWMLDTNLSMKVPKMCSKKPTLRCLFWKLLSGVPAPVTQVRPNWSPSGLLWRLHPVLPCHAGRRFGWKEQQNYTKDFSIDPFHMHEARLFL